MPRRHRSPANCIDTRESRDPVIPLLPVPGRKDGREIAIAQVVELGWFRRHLDDVGLVAVVDEEQLPGVLRSVEVDAQRRRTADCGPTDCAEGATYADLAASEERIPARIDRRERNKLADVRHAEPVRARRSRAGRGAA